MQDILEYIKQQEKKFSQLPFFQFLTNSNIDPHQRLVWFPCLAHFAMSFKDLNNDILQDSMSDHPLQKLINQHAIEDGSHWKWYLKDLESLEIDQVMRFSDFLKFVWSEKTIKTRRLSNNLVAMCRYETDIALKIVIIATIEATGSTAQRAMAQVGEELRAKTNKKYFYVSPHHLNVENAHLQFALENNNSESCLVNIELNAEQKAKALVLIDYVFDSFTECMDGLMQFASQHKFKELVARPKYALHR
ncbi:hypothetical protein NIES21_42980 [Anabaenopsis circularis NIES-21]|uniref:Uncharacterized protein n=2 Tax=Nostocales TaxID=1161 RepID=A0A1Z4GLQ9_9CYAN|nr:hypothetical protein [Nostoc cycadae]BAY18451.1 hypothetical protein NIES21_42980 [Anabaenopsis circularis NIES-21]GBE90489.1 hypothetical protein NCWK1_0205 [Nostoc cycadae WK-1]